MGSREDAPIATATYSPDDNKLRLYPFARLDADTYARVKAAGFAWAPKQELFVAPMWTPSREALALELAGEIGDEDKTLADRAAARAERFDEYSDKREADANAAHRSVDAISGRFELGQPILIGHHSEKRARKDKERMEAGMRRAVKMWETSEYWTYRAEGARAHALYAERPDVRARRIKKIEADRRKAVKDLEESQMWLKLWTAPGLTLEQARAIASRCHLTVTRTNADGTPTVSGWQAYDVLRPEDERYDACPVFTVEQVQAAAARAYPRAIEYRQKWIAHYDNRLAYERAMLGESGYIEPPKGPTRAALPLLNYAGEVRYRNKWKRGEILTAQAQGITRAELADIGSDYKGTVISEDGTHRIRTAILGRGSARGTQIIYLTDAKMHTRPGAGPIETREQAETAARVSKGLERLARDTEAAKRVREHNRAIVAAHGKLDADATPPASAPDAGATFKAMKETLRAGVQVVVAPQLFPTPRDLAERMARMLDVQPGDSCLEPSAGTGMLIGALGGRMFGRDDVKYGRVHAVEINGALCPRLRTEFPLTVVHQGDFLTMTAEDFGVGSGFHRIIMNPPFKDGADIKHILHARTMLRPGGRLVVICANGPRQRESLMPLAASWEDLPAGTFKESGTNVSTALLVMEG